MYGDKGYIFFGAVWGITFSTGTVDVLEELTVTDEVEPELGVGVGEVGGFKSS